MFYVIKMITPSPNLSGFISSSSSRTLLLVHTYKNKYKDKISNDDKLL